MLCVDPTFGSIMRSTLDLLPLQCGQKTLLLQDGLRQGYASKRQSYEFCRNPLVGDSASGAVCEPATHARTKDASASYDPCETPSSEAT
jgi:hypothetical protein